MMINDPIPATMADIISLQQLKSPVDDELLAQAIADVIQISQAQGKSLADITAELLADDALLSSQQRILLTEIVTDAWQYLSEDSLCLV